ncbi:Ras family small GTPase [Leptolyngbya sp. NIES-3755]|nr:Ras family small GTPase [Leptolyngbya sp. NIES-3755]
MTAIARKICLIGDFGVGKTSLIRQFVDRQFSDQYLSTVGVKISKKMVETVQLLIWDIEGQTKFKSISSSYLQGAKGAIIVGDATRRETLEQLAIHTEHFLSVNPKGQLAIAINKSDLIDREILEKALEQYGQQYTIYLTSAKTGENVDRLFQELAHSLIG